MGATAPSFSLPDQTGEQRQLSELLKLGPVVVFFFPAVGTPVCTREACEFRDRHAEFADVNAVVVGISRDSSRSQAQFSEDRELPYLLLSDADGSVHKRWKALLLGGVVRRVTYVVGTDGRIKLAHSAQFRGKDHVRSALKAISELS